MFLGIYSSIGWPFQFSTPKQEVRSGLLLNKSKQKTQNMTYQHLVAWFSGVYTAGLVQYCVKRSMKGQHSR